MIFLLENPHKFPPNSNFLLIFFFFILHELPKISNKLFQKFFFFLNKRLYFFIQSRIRSSLHFSQTFAFEISDSSVNAARHTLHFGLNGSNLNRKKPKFSARQLPGKFYA